MKVKNYKIQEETAHIAGEPAVACGYSSHVNFAERYMPNADTIAAIEEARAGKYAGTIDMTNFDTFMNSINAIE